MGADLKKRPVHWRSKKGKKISAPISAPMLREEMDDLRPLALMVSRKTLCRRISRQ
jgi:hypothetical protein